MPQKLILTPQLKLFPSNPVLAKSVFLTLIAASSDSTNSASSHEDLQEKHAYSKDQLARIIIRRPPC